MRTTVWVTARVMVVLGVALAACCLAPGCAQPRSGPAGSVGATEPGDRPLPEGFDPVDQPRTGDGDHPDWPFWPVRMRLHPLTMISLDPDSGQRIIEARVEMLDEFDDTTKTVAQMRFELHDHEPRGPEEPQRAWNVDLRDPKANALHYDKVTQTYLFRLGIDEGDAATGEDAHLRVYVLSVTGRQFESIIKLH